MNDLLQSNIESQGRPVECLGIKFLNDDDRRAYFLKLLADKLRDPQFRNIEGFPVGSDEAILKLSDPPYYTACPNPFVQEFIALHGTPYDPGAPYLKEPFTADVSEGKYDPLYKLHPYHTKVPPKAIMRYILHYTQPGALIFDGFCGTGMTGVAAQLCGDVGAIEELGYKVDGSGIIYQKLTDGESAQWLPFSKLGQRFALLNDLSPAASFISYKHNAVLDLHVFERRSGRILTKVAQQCGWMYQTLHRPTESQIVDAVDVIARSATPDLTTAGPTGQINYVVWSDLFSCPECSGEINFWRDAVNISAGKVKESFYVLTAVSRWSKEI